MHEIAKDSPLARCLPVSVRFHDFFNLVRIVQTPALTVMLYGRRTARIERYSPMAAICPRIESDLARLLDRAWRRYVRHHDRRFQ